MLIYFEGQNDECYTNQNSTEYSLSNKSLQYLKSAIKTLSSSHFLNSKFNMSEIDLFTEDLEAHYITVIKNLIRSLDSEKLSSYYNASQNKFPILEIILEYSHNQDIMIRNAARISMMWIFKNCHGKAMDYIISVTIPKHSTDIIKNLMQNALSIQNFYKEKNSTALEKEYLSYKEELEYLEDISNLNFCIKKQVTLMLLNHFIEPFILKAIFTKRNESLLSRLVGLFLLSNLLKTTRNITIKNYISNIFLQDDSKKNAETNSITKNESNEAYKYLQHILQRNDFDISTLCVLHILSVLQLHIEENHIKVIQFYNKFTLDLINLFMLSNNFIDRDLNCIKLKLLTLIFKPLTEKDINDFRWLTLKKYFFEILKILYYDTCRQIRCKVSNLDTVIDKEYEIFINLKININIFFENINILNKGNDRNFAAVPKLKNVSISTLFHIRQLYLKLRDKNENILPIIEGREEIGTIVQIDSCLQCEKLTHNNHYNNNHFLKFTEKQLLIVQAIQIKSHGIVVFNSFYKDISWSVDINNIMKIYEVCFSDQFGKVVKPISLHLKFSNVADIQTVIKFLLNARLKQAKIAKKKLKELLQLKSFVRHEDLKLRN